MASVLAEGRPKDLLASRQDARQPLVSGHLNEATLKRQSRTAARLPEIRRQTNRMETDKIKEPPADPGRSPEAEAIRPLMTTIATEVNKPVEAAPRRRQPAFFVPESGRRGRTTAGREERSDRATTAGGSGLGTKANCFTPSESARTRRYKLRETIQDITTLERVRKCGRVPTGGLVMLRSAEDGSRPGVAGLQSCGSVWACPRCASVVAVRRAEELGGVLERADEAGLVVSLQTLTMRHRKGQRLSDLWQALSYAWNKVTAGKQWKRDQERIGLIGWARAAEVTHGANGWHVHLHVAVVSERDPLKTDVPLRVFGRWARGLASKGLESVADSGGFDWQVAARGDGATIGGYVAKMQTASGLGAEATLGAWKKARGGNRTPFQIAHDLGTTGDMADIELWWEYENASHGKRALTWSKKLREWAKLGQEKTDEELAEESAGDIPHAVIDPDSFFRFRENVPQILDVCEAQGPAAALRLLDALGIDWHPPG